MILFKKVKLTFNKFTSSYSTYLFETFFNIEINKYNDRTNSHWDKKYYENWLKIDLKGSPNKFSLFSAYITYPFIFPPLHEPSIFTVHRYSSLKRCKLLFPLREYSVSHPSAMRNHRLLKTAERKLNAQWGQDGKLHERLNTFPPVIKEQSSRACRFNPTTRFDR